MQATIDARPTLLAVGILALSLTACGGSGGSDGSRTKLVTVHNETSASLVRWDWRWYDRCSLCFGGPRDPDEVAEGEFGPPLMPGTSTVVEVPVRGREDVGHGEMTVHAVGERWFTYVSGSVARFDDDSWKAALDAVAGVVTIENDSPCFWANGTLRNEDAGEIIVVEPFEPWTQRQIGPVPPGSYQVNLVGFDEHGEPRAMRGVITIQGIEAVLLDAVQQSPRLSGIRPDEPGSSRRR